MAEFLPHPALVTPLACLTRCSSLLGMGAKNAHQECQMHQLPAGIGQSPAVLPQPQVLLQPCKAALDIPALGCHRKPGFFKARSSRMPPPRGSLQTAKWECTVRHWGNSSGTLRHCQPPLGRYSTAQNTPYRSLAGDWFLWVRSPAGAGQGLGSLELPTAGSAWATLSFPIAPGLCTSCKDFEHALKHCGIAASRHCGAAARGRSAQQSAMQHLRRRFRLRALQPLQAAGGRRPARAGRCPGPAAAQPRVQPRGLRRWE